MDDDLFDDLFRNDVMHEMIKQKKDMEDRMLYEEPGDRVFLTDKDILIEAIRVIERQIRENLRYAENAMKAANMGAVEQQMAYVNDLLRIGSQIAGLAHGMEGANEST